MKRFIKIPKTVLELELTPMELMIYASILSFKSKKDYAIVKASVVANRCDVHRNSVYRSVNELETKGLIQRVSNYKNGKRSTNGYLFNDMQGKFIKLPYSIFDKNLKPSAFATYVTMKSYENHSKRSFCSLSQLRKSVGVCVDTVISAVKELVSLGLITYKRYMRKCGCMGHNNYFLEVPQAVSVKDENKKIVAISFTARMKKMATSLFNKRGTRNFVQLVLDLPRYLVRKKEIFLLYSSKLFIRLIE